MRSTTPTRVPLPERSQDPPPVSVAICGRCGDVSVDDTPCRCRTPYDETEVRRRHREAVARARRTTTGRRRRRPRANPAA